MNLEKFRHEHPRNAGYINKSVVRANFGRFSRERAEQIKFSGVFSMDESSQQSILFLKENK